MAYDLSLEMAVWLIHTYGEAHMAVNAFWTLAVPRLVNTVTGVPHRGLE